MSNKKGANWTTILEIMFSGGFEPDLGFELLNTFLQADELTGKTSAGQNWSVMGPRVLLWNSRNTRAPSDEHSRFTEEVAHSYQVLKPQHKAS